MKLIRNSKLALGGILVAGLAACGGGGGGSASTESSGTLRLALSDAPACGYDAVNVTIEKVRIHQSDSANPDDPNGWSEIVMTPALRVDLLKLQNGALAELGELTLSTGSYNQMRLVLADNQTSALANSVVLTSNKTEVALKTPSGQQSGVKAKQFNLTIAANQLANFVVDFDACKSVVAAGNSGQYLLKPQLSVLPRYISGVTGFVDATMANGFTSVSLQQNGVVIKATAPNSDAVNSTNFGKFMLQPVAPGNYSLVLTAPGRTTAVVTNLAVVADMVTRINTADTALNPAPSASGTVTGTAPLDTLVYALQPLAAGPTVQVAGRFVDGIAGNLTLGRYTYPLTVNAPLVAPYVAGLPLVFVNDPVAGKYTLNASLTGYADKVTVLPTLAAGATVQSNLTFP